jgi:hypothetical protein
MGEVLIPKRRQVRTRRQALGLSGADVDVAAGLHFGMTLRFENSKEPVEGKWVDRYELLMRTLEKLRATELDYAGLIDEWMRMNGATYREFSEIVGISSSHLFDLRREGLSNFRRHEVRAKLDAFFATWKKVKRMNRSQRLALYEAEERWKMIETDASARVLIDFYDPTDDELAA